MCCELKWIKLMKQRFLVWDVVTHVKWLTRQLKLCVIYVNIDLMMMHPSTSHNHRLRKLMLYCWLGNTGRVESAMMVHGWPGTYITELEMLLNFYADLIWILYSTRQSTGSLVRGTHSTVLCQLHSIMQQHASWECQETLEEITEVSSYEICLAIETPKCKR